MWQNFYDQKLVRKWILCTFKKFMRQHWFCLFRESSLCLLFVCLFINESASVCYWKQPRNNLVKFPFLVEDTRLVLSMCFCLVYFWLALQETLSAAWQGWRLSGALPRITSQQENSCLAKLGKPETQRIVWVCLEKTLAIGWCTEQRLCVWHLITSCFTRGNVW